MLAPSGGTGGFSERAGPLPPLSSKEESQMSGKKATWLFVVSLMIAAAALALAMTAPAQAGWFNCKIVVCAAPDCLEGEHLYRPPDQCCPICVPD